MKISNGANAPLELDEVDSGIIEILRSNGRATNQDIADPLSISAATVSADLPALFPAWVSAD